MTVPPQVSCIISTYNRRERLLQAIESVRAQDGVAIEILVCDDGSTDGTADAVRSIADPRIRFLTGPHGGLSAAVRNRGIASARGDWLAFLDDDDLWRPGKLRAQLDALAEAGTMAATTNADIIRDGRVEERPYRDDLPDRARFDFDRLVRTNNVVMSSAMIHRSLLPLVKGFPASRGFRTLEDHALWLRVAALTDFIYLDDPLIGYTADSVDSVRIGMNWHIQRARVLTNFLFWAVRTGRPPRFALGAGRQLAKQAVGYATGRIRRGIGAIRPARLERAPYIRIPDFLPADVRSRDGIDLPVAVETRIQEILPEALARLGLGPLHKATFEQASTANEALLGPIPRADNGTPDTVSRVLTYVYCVGGGRVRLYDTQIKGRVRSATGSFTDLDPADNTLVLFPSQVFHAVQPTELPSASGDGDGITIIGRVRDEIPSRPDAPQTPGPPQIARS